MRSWLTWVASTALGVVLLSASVAHAHPILEEAQRHFEEADFEAALEAYGRAEQAADLSRDDLIQLYVRRALIHHTLGNTADLEADLMRLATLEPQYDFGRQAPPVVVEAFERMRERTTGQLSVRIDATTQPGGVRLEARVSNDTAAIVQEVRLGARAPGNAWTLRSNAALEMPAPSDSTLEIFAEAIGPGGAIVASDGTSAEPVTSIVRDLPTRHQTTEREGPEIVTPPPSDEGVPVWPFILGAGVLAAAGAAVLIILLTSGNENTDLRPPMVL
jgi:hypothetical protein